jgi:nucleoside-diphosphate-sugar epimerase
MTYGPGQDSTKLIPTVALALLNGESPKLSSGRLEVDWVYIDDVIEGFLQAALAPGIDGETIDLGSGTLTSVRGIVDRLASIIGSEAKPLLGALPDRPFERGRLADTAGALAQIGWKATTPLEQGLQQTVDWYREQQRMMRYDKAGGAAPVS